MPCSKLRSLFLFCLIFLSCSAPYKKLGFSAATDFSALAYKPEFEKALYRCMVDGGFFFKKFHLSGLLVLKKMEDSSTRVVFQNEMGFSFFDFEWDKEDGFKVNSILPQLNKPAVIKTLQKDFQLILLKDLDWEREASVFENGKQISRFPLEKGFAYYVATKPESGRNEWMLSEIEVAGSTKVTSILLSGKKTKKDMADSILINHHKANFTIQLKKIDSHVDG